MNDVMVQGEVFSGRCQKVLQVAKQLYQEKPDWVTFFRETLGVKGAARSVFINQAEYVQFEQFKRVCRDPKHGCQSPNSQGQRQQK